MQMYTDTPVFLGHSKELPYTLQNFTSQTNAEYEERVISNSLKIK